MKKERFYELLGEINEKYVEEAESFQRSKKSIWVRWGALAACSCLVVALIPLINSMVNTDTPSNPEPGALTAHFYLDGNGFFYHGELTYELPEGYVLIGNVINVGDMASVSRKDFEGNVDGKIYMNQTVSDTAYFSWAEWDEDTDGPVPFLKLELITTE